MLEDIIKTPDVIADNRTHHSDSFLLYKYIDGNTKSCMECAVVKRDDGYVIHYQKIKMRKLKKLKKDNRVIWGFDKMDY